MRKRAASAVLVGLLACTACLGPVDDVSTPTPASSPPAPVPEDQVPEDQVPEDPEAGSAVERWALFVRMAKQERLPRHTWPSTAKNATVTAAIVCHNPASHGATEVDMYHGRRDWPEIRRGDILFARAFCPEAVPALTRALSGRPGSPRTTTVPAEHRVPARR